MPPTFNTLTQTIFIHFRRRRMKRFFATMMPSPDVRVLDIGGTVQTWNDESEPSQFPVTLLNVRGDGRFDGGRFRAVEGDAKRLPFTDNASRFQIK